MTDHSKLASSKTPQRRPSPLGKRGAPLLLAGVVGAALLAGCGGGGGNGNNNGGTTGTGVGDNGGTNSGTNTGTLTNASISGKVVDVSGNGLPGVNLNVDTGGIIATSLGQGGYRIDGLTGGVIHQVTAAITRQDGTVYSGSTQVATQGGSLVSNVNIIVSPQGQQATVGGTVVDGNNNPVAGAQVFLVVPNSHFFSSLTAFTDGNGRYAIGNVPSNLPTGQVLVTASAVGAASQTSTLSGLSAGGTYSQNFTLSGATGIRLAPPVLQAVFASTEPTDSLSGAVRSGHVAGGAAGGLYDALRRRLSPAFARLAGKRQAVGKRRVAHAAGGTYAIETDVAFGTPNQTGGSILSYTVYLTTGAGTANAPQQILGDIRDVLQDPLANYYTDVTFSGDAIGGPFTAYAPQTQYNFALDAVSTDTPSTKSALSLPLSIVPLGPLTLIQPQVGQPLTSDPTLSWNGATGASRYAVFIYDQYPTPDVNAVYSSVTSNDPIPGSQTTFTLPGSLSGPATYYAVVVGVNDQTEGSDVNGSPVSVTGAAASFSQITRFNVQ